MVIKTLKLDVTQSPLFLGSWSKRKEQQNPQGVGEYMGVSENKGYLILGFF